MGILDVWGIKALAYESFARPRHYRQQKFMLGWRVRVGLGFRV